ncbi:MAG: signal peptidase II, partial [Treponema sp.]|nr:signal peptidase II [Treponema sp.]
IPIIVMVMVIVVYLRNNDFTKLQRWCIAGIVGGGIGNLIDRIFRAEGVVDFIDVKFYGLFGLERWPTFNVADSAVVVCGILLVISFIQTIIADSKANKENQ